jgi:3-oxoacyl-[acyl-carrier protein] reductase
MLDFTGHRAVVLGGTCDLALGLTKHLIANGLRPILTYRNEKGRDRIRAELAGSEGTYETVYLDLSKPDSVDKAFHGIGDDIDYLIDFAHGHLECLVGASNTKKVDQYFRENVTARARVLKWAARAFLKRKRGRFVYISSAAVVRSNPGQGFYVASKLASEALYRNLGIELAGHGITTLSLRLGYVEAGRGKAYLDRVGHEKHAAFEKPRTPLAIETVVESILFYLSDAAVGFHATEIRMDAGHAAAK